MAAVTVTTAGRVWNEASTTSYWAARCRAITTNGVYIVVQDTANARLRVFKGNSATNPTSFSEVDSGTTVSVNGTSPFSVKDDDTRYIHVAYFSAAATLTHARFDTQTDTWTTNNGNIHTGASNTRPVRISLNFANGRPVATFTSSADTADIIVSAYDGSSWLSINVLAITSGEGSTVTEIIGDGTSIASIVYYNCLDDDVEYKTLTSAGSLSAAVDVDATGPTADTAHSAGGAFVIYDVSGTDTVIFGYLNSGPSIDSRVASLEATAAAGRLAAEASVHGTAANVGARSTVLTGRVGSTDYAVWWDDASSGTIYYSTRSGGAWSAQTSWKTGVSMPTDLVIIGSTIGVVYHSAALTVQFDWIVAPAGDASASITRDQLTTSGKGFTVSAGVAATVTADALTLSGKTFTATAGAGATITKDALTVSGQAFTATGQRNESVTITADALTVSKQAFVAGAGASASITADSLAVSGQAFAVAAGASATIAADALSTSGKTFTATGQRNESATITADSLTVSEQAFTVAAGASATVTTDSLAVSGQSFTATAGQGASASIGADALTVSGQSFAVAAGTSVSITADALTASGQPFTVAAGESAAAAITADSLAVSGQAFAVSAGTSATIARDELTASGQPFTVTAGASATIAADALTVSGQAFTAEAGESGDASATITADALAVSGQAFTVSADAIATVTADSLTAAGKTFTASAGASASVGADALTVDGQEFAASAGTSSAIARDMLEVQGRSFMPSAGASAIIDADVLVIVGQTFTASATDGVPITPSITLTGYRSAIAVSGARSALAVSGARPAANIDGSRELVGALRGYRPTELKE